MSRDPATITRTDLHDSAMLFSALHDGPTFTARSFAEFTGVAALHLDEELANDVLLEVVERGFLREVGPGVYALAESGTAPMEHPVFSEDLSAQQA